MDRSDKGAGRAEEKLRREAAAWFARMRGPNAVTHQAAFDHWRTARPEHQAVYDRLLRRWEGAAVLGMVRRAAPAGSDVRLGVWNLRRVWWASAPPAAAALATVILFLSPVRPDWVDFWPVPSAWSQRVATEVGQIRRVTLSDGSVVTLDTDTIVVSRLSSAVRRLVLLRGRARFDVAHDPNRPFIVAAGGASVAARGTLFDVALNPGHKVAVTLIRGIVDVEGPAKSSQTLAPWHGHARLVAGQQIAFGRDLPSPCVQPASPAGALWPDGLLTFEATPLSDAVAQANRYSRTHILLASPALGALQVSGVFRATAPRALADSLAAAFDLQVKSDPDGDIVLDRQGPPLAEPAA